MSGFLGSPWVVGIGTGILSGLLVWLITKFFVSRSENRELKQKIVSANREVLYALRPSVSENRVPSKDVVIALIAATSRKYDVEPKFLASSEQISEDLIKEVMDSNFISPEMKEAYCEHLSELRRVESTAPKTSPPPPESLMKERYISLLSMMTGLMAAITTGLLAITESGKFSHIPDESLRLFIPVLAAVGSLGAVSVYSIIRRGRRAQQESSFDIMMLKNAAEFLSSKKPKKEKGGD